MRTLLVAILGTLFLVVGGCQKDKSDTKHDNMQMSGDACPHCAGVQKATADGKCPMCGRKVSMSSSSSGAAPASASADACSECPGIQTATADGKCPECGMAVAKK
jgi:endogenous inhibitor of DNA gyrase (YacG/DUF329 family)